jgi:hypothetical protein
MSAFNKQEGGSHYKDLKIEPAIYCHRNKLGYLESSAIKYLTRYNLKWPDNHDKQLEDLAKAKHCIEMLIEELKAENFEAMFVTNQENTLQTGGITVPMSEGTAQVVECANKVPDSGAVTS